MELLAIVRLGLKAHFMELPMVDNATKIANLNELRRLLSELDSTLVGELDELHRLKEH
jgi:hypothetical protein